MKEYNALAVVPVTMSSREIAELTGKQHSNVMRDIRAMTERLSADSNLNWHCETEIYTDEQGKPREMYRLDKDTTLTLVSGYDAVLRFRIIKRWQELETAQQTALPPPKAPKLTREERYRLGVYRDAVKTAELVGLSGNMARLATAAAAFRNAVMGMEERFFRSRFKDMPAELLAEPSEDQPAQSLIVF